MNRHKSPLTTRVDNLPFLAYVRAKSGRLSTLDDLAGITAIYNQLWRNTLRSSGDGFIVYMYGGGTQD